MRPRCICFVHPLQDVALHQYLPLSSVCCFPVPGGSLLPCYVVLPSSALSSPWSLPSPWLPLCAAFGPSTVLHSCYMTGPSPLLFQCVFYNACYLCSFPDQWAWYLTALDLTFNIRIKVADNKKSRHLCHLNWRQQQQQQQNMLQWRRQGQIAAPFDGCTRKWNKIVSCWTSQKHTDCISVTDLLRHVYMPPHCGRSCRSNLLSNPFTVSGMSTG